MKVLFLEREKFFSFHASATFPKKPIIAAHTKAHDYLLKSSTESLDDESFCFSAFWNWMACIKNWSESVQ